MNNQSPPLAYLVSRYPAVSHTFISREIAQLRALGHVIRTASINPPDRSLERMDEAERQEALATYGVKGHGAVGALAALAYWAVRNPLRLLHVVRLGSKSASPLRGLAYAVEAAMVAKWMADNHLAHLHVHFGNSGASVGVLVKALTECHLSLTIHGPDEFDDVPGQQLAKKMAAADVVVCISQFARSQLMRISLPDDWLKFKVCRLGVNSAQFMGVRSRADRAHTNLLCVGRLTPAKGQVLLIQACARLRDAGVRFSMNLVGDGPDRGRVEAAVAHHGLQELVKFSGSLTQQGVREALSEADIFVLPSLAEGIPVVLMEAMCCHVPCISTPVNGIPELIEHKHTGLLATPGDVDSLVAQLLYLCGSREARERLAQDALVKVQQDFDLNRNVRHLSAIFSAFPIASGSVT
jgi:colanic acid/amylovoran biosynthesis glycosyltransferase